jgi:glycosyltransferase involved in cell wall biosynthesis
VVDGGSTDGSRAWLAAQPDVVLIGQRGPLTGAVKAFNLGFGYAVTNGFQYVAHLNDDAEIVATENALEDTVHQLDRNPQIGAIAFAYNLYGEYAFSYVNGRLYSNFGVIRAWAGMEVAAAQGDPTGRNWWNPIYRTYGADSEFGVWLHKLGWQVVDSEHRVNDLNVQDELRKLNGCDDPDRPDTKLFWRRWRDERFEQIPKPEVIAK